MNLLAIISSYFPSLTKSEQKVAQFVLTNPDEVENYSINELAEFAEVGESTVVRFCRKVGFPGFQDFKIALAKNQTTQFTPGVAEEEGLKGIVYHQLVESLTETKQFMENEEIDQAAELIDQAERIFLFGVGNTLATITELRNRLSRIGFQVIYSADSHLQAIDAALMTDKDVAVALSISGNTKDVLVNIKIAKEQGAKVIAITNYIKSAITKTADLALICSAKEAATDAGSFANKIAQLYLLDVLCKSVAERNKEHVHELRKRTNKALMERLES
ncbi:MurR/RpiR family transcriptional regulator [Listeria ilorinensis]|uniref:MurR/RpiR family transcriptional regulator n=1 Tax=Listeria ilorinensis TaxID=2867439 RepID=UPI001EF45CB2|nr:MurR/RpiR family transcriptional regulator [Listeria ilorinensis]